MLRTIKQICEDKLGASDGEIGHVKDFYFDDQHWAVRYLVADTGSWLSGRQVLISPLAFGSLYQGGKVLLVKLTRKQIEDSPSIDAHKPVSRQYEEEYYRHYGWPSYWQGDSVWGGLGDFPILSEKSKMFSPEPAVKNGAKPAHFGTHLRSAKAIIGYRIQAGEDTVGQVADFMMNDRSWVIERIVVNTGKRFTGKKVLLLPAQVNRISYEESKVFVDLTKEAITALSAYEEDHAHLAAAAH
jgi:hypothetical protein